MFEDPIVNEVREIRRKHSERYGNDLNKIVAALQERERNAANLIQPKTPRPQGGTGQKQQ